MTTNNTEKKHVTKAERATEAHGLYSVVYGPGKKWGVVLAAGLTLEKALAFTNKARTEWNVRARVCLAG